MLILILSGELHCLGTWATLAEPTSSAWTPADSSRCSAHSILNPSQQLRLLRQRCVLHALIPKGRFLGRVRTYQKGFKNMSLLVRKRSLSCQMMDNRNECGDPKRTNSSRTCTDKMKNVCMAHGEEKCGVCHSHRCCNLISQCDRFIKGK